MRSSVVVIDRGVRPSRHRHAVVHAAELRIGLFRIVGDVEGAVQEERPVLVLDDESGRLADHQVRKVPPCLVDLLAVSIQVVKGGPPRVRVQELVLEIVYEAAQMPVRLVKALVQGLMSGLGAEVPLPGEAGPIAVLPKDFRQRDLADMHVAAVLVQGIVREPVCHARPLRNAPGQKLRARGTAHGVCIRLGEAHAAPGECVDVRRVNVVRAVAARIERSLVVRVDDDDIRALAGLRCWAAGRAKGSADRSHESSPRQFPHRPMLSEPQASLPPFGAVRLQPADFMGSLLRAPGRSRTRWRQPPGSCPERRSATAPRPSPSAPPRCRSDGGNRCVTGTRRRF